MRRHHALHVERIGRHRQLAAVRAPRAPWSIGVDLDPQTVRIPQIERFADETIGLADPHVEPRNMGSESAERRPLGKRMAK